AERRQLRGRARARLLAARRGDARRHRRRTDDRAVRRVRVGAVERDAVLGRVELARPDARLPGDDYLDRPRARGRAGRAVGGAVGRPEGAHTEKGDGRWDQEAAHLARIMPGLSVELLAGEGAEALACGVVRSERLVVRVGRVGRDLLGDLPHLGGEHVVVARILEQRLDPALRAVVGGDVVVEEQLPERDPAADVGERAEREDPARRLDEPRDLGVLVDDLLDDRADRLVDERDPQLLVPGHRPDYGCFPRARHAICAAVRISRTAKSLRRTCSGSDSATWAPPTAAPTDAIPITAAGRQRTLP